MTTKTDIKHTWLAWLEQIARPILVPMAKGQLRATMKVEARDPRCADHTHLEALGRLLAGIAPWLESGQGALRDELLDLSLRALDHAVDPDSPDRLNFSVGRQPVVDTAFLCQALLRAPTALLERLSATTRAHLIDALLSSRICQPAFNNWLLFSATVEAALYKLGADWDRMRVDYALRQHEQWYLGDGHYADGPSFHWDYYNSFVILPMLVDVVAAVKHAPRVYGWEAMEQPILARARRYAAILERLVSPEGTLPPIGRSLAYRFGALHALAQAALLDNLPEDLPAAQARSAMHVVIDRLISAPGTFDEAGYLRVGFCGHQPAIGELYISTGSLYLCSAAFLPLGLADSHPFWADPAMPWTQARIYAGEDMPTDHALTES